VKTALHHVRTSSVRNKRLHLSRPHLSKPHLLKPLRPKQHKPRQGLSWRLQQHLPKWHRKWPHP
jgi:hypothetical protein